MMVTVATSHEGGRLRPMVGAACCLYCHLAWMCRSTFQAADRQALPEEHAKGSWYPKRYRALYL